MVLFSPFITLHHQLDKVVIIGKKLRCRHGQKEKKEKDIEKQEIKKDGLFSVSVSFPRVGNKWTDNKMAFLKKNEGAK